ncbi:MAG: hypothetical protein RL397_1020, partial [Pseudomonadota bacterium]
MQGEAVGSYGISLQGLSNPNYVITSTGNTFRINPRPVTVSVASKSKVYREVDPELTYTTLADGVGGSRGLVAGQPLSVGLSRDAGDDVGVYAIDSSIGSNPNYRVTVNSASLSITPRPVRVAAQDVTRTFGEENPVFTYSTERGEIGSARGSLLPEAASAYPQHPLPHQVHPINKVGRRDHSPQITPAHP